MYDHTPYVYKQELTQACMHILYRVYKMTECVTSNNLWKYSTTGNLIMLPLVQDRY